jgi:MFS family permease
VAVDVTPLRESPGFRRLWVGQSIAYVAWRMMLVLVPVQVYGLTGSTLDVGLVSLVQFVPLVVFTIIGGALADVHDRRRLLVWSTAGIAGACAAFVAISAAGSPSLGLVVGPAIAGVLIATIGFAATYGVSLAGILVALVATYLLPPVPPQENAPRMTFDTIVDGFRYLRLQQLTSLRLSIVSGGIGCVAGTLVVVAFFPLLLRYDARERAPA